MLGEIINKYAQQVANNQNWSQVIELLSTPTIQKLNDTAWTIGLIQSELGSEIAEKVAAVMKIAGDTNPIVSAAFIAISTVGLQFYSEDRQQMIEQLGLAGGMSTEEISSLKHLGKKILSPLEEHGLPVPSVAEVQQAWEDFSNPPVPDTQSFEVLLSVNRQADGSMNAFASVTPVLLRDGKVLSKGQPVRHVNGALRDAVQPLIDELMRGD